MLDQGKDLDWFNSNVIISLAVITVVCLAAWIIRGQICGLQGMNVGLVVDRRTMPMVAVKFLTSGTARSRSTPLLMSDAAFCAGNRTKYRRNHAPHSTAPVCAAAEISPIPWSNGVVSALVV